MSSLISVKVIQRHLNFRSLGMSTNRQYFLHSRDRNFRSAVPFAPQMWRFIEHETGRPSLQLGIPHLSEPDLKARASMRWRKSRQFPTRDPPSFWARSKGQGFYEMEKIATIAVEDRPKSRSIDHRNLLWEKASLSLSLQPSLNVLPLVRRPTANGATSSSRRTLASVLDTINPALEIVETPSMVPFPLRESSDHSRSQSNEDSENDDADFMLP